MTGGNKTGKRRELWLDVLRVLAACAVVMMHTLTGAVDIYHVADYTNGKLMLIIMDLVTWCVPVFLMISGYLFLKPKKKIGLKTMVSKYCLRVVLALLVFGIPFSCLELILAERTVRIGMVWEGFLMVLTMKSWSHLWYLYLILVLYLLTPAFVWVVERLPLWSVVTVEFVLAAGSCVLPFINQVLESTKIKALPEQLIFIFYYLAGYLLHAERLERSNRKRQWCLGACVGIIIIGMVVYRLSDIRQIQMAYNYPPTVLLALGLMLLGQGLYCRSGRTWAGDIPKNLILSLSGLSFGIYLVHPVFLNLFYKLLHVMPVEGNFAVRFPVFFAVTFLGAAGTTWILKKIPPLRKYVL